MILTLLWKELREHRSIWLTMVVMTCVLGFGLTRIVVPDDAALATMVGALIVLGMGATYGIVCGGMMLAGEHEGGTLVFLDIFLGRRHLLWLGKFLIGIVLVLAEALAVALVFYVIKQAPPAWAPALVGVTGMDRMLLPNAPLGSNLEIWFIVLAVTLEAYAWGLFGSAVTRRVLAGAAVAAVAAAPVWLAGTCLPAPAALLLRLLAVSFVLIVSIAHFVTQSREVSLGPPPKPDDEADPRKRFIEILDDFDEDYEFADDAWPVMDVPRARPVVLALAANHSGPPANAAATAARVCPGGIANRGPLVADLPAGLGHWRRARGRMSSGWIFHTESRPGALARCHAAPGCGVRHGGVRSRTARSRISVPRGPAFSLADHLANQGGLLGNRGGARDPDDCFRGTAGRGGTIAGAGRSCRGPGGSI
jgi:hypothetical protein